MRNAAILYSVLAMATAGLAMPAASPLIVGTEGLLTSTPIHGALAADKTAPPEVTEVAAPPPYMTISVINMHGSALTTSHARNAGAPAAVSGNVAKGTIANGATATFAVPTGWAGNIALTGSEYALTGNDALIEASFEFQSDSGGVAVPDIDVSYVNAFTVAITCECVATDTYITGCNKNLFSYNTCADLDPNHACINPLRNNNGPNLTPAPFFAPCNGAAYTYPMDQGANANRLCQSANFRCCVGAGCPADPKQTGDPN